MSSARCTGLNLQAMHATATASEIRRRMALVVTGVTQRAAVGEDAVNCHAPRVR